MKKFGGFVLTTLIAVIMVVAAFCLPTKVSINLDEQKNEETASAYYVPPSFFDSVKIACEENGNLLGRELKTKDFDDPEFGTDDVNAVFRTTKTVTIYLDHEVAYGETLSITANGNPIVTNNVASIENPHVQKFGNLNYYVFSINDIDPANSKELTTKISISYRINNQTMNFTFSLIQIYVSGSIFDYLKISQDGNGDDLGYTFTAKDFVDTKVNSSAPATLYTNRTITIYVDTSALSLDTGDTYTLIDGSTYLARNGIVVSDGNQRLHEINGKNYFVFDITELESDTATRIFFSVTHGGETNTFEFMLVQTLTNFQRGGISWSFNENNATEKVITSPSFEHTYSPITLYLPSASELNPITVRFTYCGEVFEIYKKGDTLYNPSLEAENKDGKLPFKNMTFDVSGTYTVEIFDKTYNKNNSANNYMVYVFNVENSTTELDRFYFNAHLEDGTIIMNRQITNEKTSVEFVNINNPRILEQIQRIEVERIARTANENISTTTTYLESQIRDIIQNQNSTLSFEEDGNYSIRVYTHDSLSTASKTFNFRILKNISNQFIIDNTEYNVDDDALDNETRRVNITRTTTTSYESKTCPVTSRTSYEFYILIARSAPRIDGVNDKARVSGNVDLTVSGVGKLQVTITQDGKTTTREFDTEEGNTANNHLLQTFSTPGHYVISIQDEMGSIMTKSFTIKVKMNTAAMILLIIAGVVVALVIVFIIFSRMRVKVR